MNFGDVLYESKDRVATITLNRPERYNAISENMPGDIADAFEHAAVAGRGYERTGSGPGCG